ncbi:MAG TPA: glycogen debranching N-terminal domain-containing protein [Trebonia sp.]|nr:glycogen debranching N-terminal domain-containing protein [Trebonia sp.]
MAAFDQPWLHELVTVLSAPTVALSDSAGQIRPAGAHGVLHADVRVLSAAVLDVDGREPALVSSGLLGARTARFVAVPRELGDGIVDPTVRVERERTVLPGEVREVLRVISAADAGVDAVLTLTVAADLADLANIKDGRPGPPAVPIEHAGDTLTWGTGTLRVTLAAPGAALAADGGQAVLRWPVRLPGRGEFGASWRLAVTDPAAPVAAVGGARTQEGPADGELPRGPWANVSAVADDPRLPALLAQSLADADALRMAVPGAPGEVFLAAGAPWYFTLFGRDSIWAARLLLPFGWELAAGTLRALAAFQGRRVDLDRGEAPGKIPHELRRSGVSYQTIDATPLWICLLHDAWRWGMPESEVAALLPALRAALTWLRDYGDSDGDCLLEYVNTTGRGLANQGWKDSGDSIRFADGRVAAPPVALCEVQGYAYEAAMRGADLLAAFGAGGAEEWRELAARIAAAFRAAFWVSDERGGYPALALDAGKRPVDALTSNIGHLLGTGLLTPAEEALVASRVGAPDLDSGFGLRTMSARNGGYNPLSYHCGSVWSHDTAIVLRGLARSGYPSQVASLADGLLAAASGFGWRLPELYSGAPRAEAPWPTPYPAACRPQAWSAAAAAVLTQALLGLDVNVPEGTITLRPLATRIGGAGPRLQVDGLVAGTETFTAGVDESGNGYLAGTTLQVVH